jgi:hypothetical protein
MNSNHTSDRDTLRAEIAAAAARMIAEDGADYGTAKRRALKQILGDVKAKGDFLPDNAQIEEEVRAYNAIFFSDIQPQRLAHLRHLALRLMKELQAYSPYVTGAVLNGTAGEHSDIHLQLFVDSPKDVEIYLLNQNVNFEVSETPHFNGRSAPVETVSFLWHNEGVHLALYSRNDLRGAAKSTQAGRVDRADIAGLAALLENSSA